MTDQDQTQADEQEEQQEPVTYNIYVTGATSQTGLALIEKLVDDGHAVAAYAAGSKDAKTLREVGALPVYGDLTHAGDILGNLQMFEADTIVNLQPQALNTPPFARRDWAALGEQLQAETDALLTAAERAEVNYILHTSFAFLAGTDNADNAVRERRPGGRAARAGRGRRSFARRLPVQRRGQTTRCTTW